MTSTGSIKVAQNYLPEQFSPDKPLGLSILQAIEAEMRQGRWTLGPQVEEFEEKWAEFCGTRYAVGVSTGTDAIFLLLKGVGVGPGHEVITSAFGFPATVGAIIQAGAKPALVDIDDSLLLDWSRALDAVGDNTRAILPVWWAGNMWEKGFRKQPKQGVHLLEDACQAFGARNKGGMAGTVGQGAAFSLHPLKAMNVMGDGGVITTDSPGLAEELRLLRNHGLAGRDTWLKPGYNMRIQTIQALVGLCLLPTVSSSVARRRAIADRYDRLLSGIPQVRLTHVGANVAPSRHLYVILAQNRDALLSWLGECGIEAKVHYPIPLHSQPAIKSLGYRDGDFPKAEAVAKETISLPCHEYMEDWQADYVAERIAEFYASRGSE